jgi:hypothetical protein
MLDCGSLAVPEFHRGFLTCGFEGNGGFPPRLSRNGEQPTIRLKAVLKASRRDKLLATTAARRQ